MLDLYKLFGVGENEEFVIESHPVFERRPFRVHNGILQLQDLCTLQWNKSLLMINQISAAYKYYYLSEKEKAFLTAIPDWAKWIARDGSGALYIYAQQPTNDGNARYVSAGKLEDVGLFSDLFCFITYETGAVEICDLKNDRKKIYQKIF